jgi:hypothetical protein
MGFKNEFRFPKRLIERRLNKFIFTLNQGVDQGNTSI